MRLLFAVIISFLITPVLAEETPFVYDDHGRRDPLWPLVSESGSILSYETDFTVADLVLEGIMAGTAGTHIAIINSKVVRTGDQLGKFTIVDVKEESVIIKKENLKFELKLEKED